MSALEDTIKQHYIYKYDPDYVREIRTPGYDPHISLAVLAGMLTEKQAEEHKLGVKSYKAIRFKAKTANFSSLYKVGYKKLSATSGMSEQEAKTLLKTFWEKNKAVLYVERDAKVKVVNGDMWIYNTISKYWYPLRYEKDKFSVINQSSASYTFDCYVKEIRKKYKICGQFHDEVIIPIEKGKEEESKKYLYECIDRVNNTLKLNVPLGISIDFGNCYASIH